MSSTKWLGGIPFLLCAACAQNPETNCPKDVASDAVFGRGAKIGWWQKCAASENGRPVQCTIWNGAGGILQTGAFLPYDGGARPIAEELKIDSDPTFPGPDRVVLSNGRILLPSSRFPELKKFVDWLKGKTSAPR